MLNVLMEKNPLISQSRSIHDIIQVTPPNLYHVVEQHNDDTISLKCFLQETELHAEVM